MSIIEITRYGKTILREMRESGRAVPIDKGGWRIGARKISRALGDTLISHDLLYKGDAGELRLSEAGHAWLKRAEHDAGKRCGLSQSTPYKYQHQTYEMLTVELDGRVENVAVNLCESPLGWLAGRKDKAGKYLLGREHVAAGEKLRKDYETGHFEGHLTAVYEPVPLASGRRGAVQVDASERRVMAKSRYDAAMDAMGPGLSDVAFSVCCNQQGLTYTERELGWPSRSAKVILKIALDRLVDHYGMRG